MVGKSVFKCGDNVLYTSINITTTIELVLSIFTEDMLMTLLVPLAIVSVHVLAICSIADLFYT